MAKIFGCFLAAWRFIQISISTRSRDRRQHLAERLDDLVDLRFLDDQRRRQADRLAGLAHQNALGKAGGEHLIGALQRRARPGLKLDRGDQADIAQVDDMVRALQAVDRILPTIES